ncbi:MAG: diaminopimelate decarboxylase [SAR86 cluster bacterium]|uniref:Diaminopimelate decarboxylase n=1 Tax=SAR86 cluster bacterium TaxID=2030880 RepID=A0A368BJA9_9GAMM|nr:MAG: diaminopimelate decarboxylase [SAR86 cluster bacterium]
MDHFNYKDGELFAEGVALKDIAKKYGTPTYVYSKATLERHAKAYIDSFESMSGLVCFSVKALSNISILKTLRISGCGFDIVSGGELHRAILAGADPKKIIFSGVGKSKDEMVAGIKHNILSFNIESEAELDRLTSVATEMNKVAPVAIRFNPNVDAGAHEFTKTGRKSDKFGVSTKTAKELIKKCTESKSINLVGLTCHIGSQIMELKGFEDAAKQALELMIALDELEINLDFIDMGGGLGVSYVGEETFQPSELIRCYETIFAGRNEKLILEPGRSISANAGIMLTKVEYEKDGFRITDAAMNDLLRPALYNAHHDVWPLVESNKQTTEVNLVGPICETGDFLAKNINISASQDDLLAVKTVGAYGFVMSSNYNSRPRAAEVLVDNKKFYLIRKREDHSSLTAFEEGLDDQI